MPRVAKELGPLAVSRISAPGVHPVGRVAGLALQVSATGSRISAGKPHERTCGLGANGLATMPDWGCRHKNLLRRLIRRKKLLGFEQCPAVTTPARMSCVARRSGRTYNSAAHQSSVLPTYLRGDDTEAESEEGQNP